MVRLFTIAVLLAAVSTQAFETPSIQTMSDQGKLVKVTGIRQLTFKGDPKPKDSTSQSFWISPDGKYVAYFGSVDGHDSYSIVSTSGGKSAIILGTLAADPETGEVFVDKPVWGVASDVPRLDWAPNGQMMAVPAALYTPGLNGGAAIRSRYILLLTPKGEIKASFSLGDREGVWKLLWSSDGKYVAAEILGYPTGEEAASALGKITVRIDVLSWATKSVSSSITLKQDPSGVRWNSTNDGFDVRYHKVSEQKTLIISTEEIDLTGKVTKTQEIPHFNAISSPDGEYLATSSIKGQLEIKSKSTGKALRTVATPGAQFAGWMPDSRMFFYTVPTAVADETQGRKEIIRQLWLATIESNKLNHMCVSTSSGNDAYGSKWSSTGAKVAYWSTGGLTVADLDITDVGADEKIVLGLPLTEGEEKTMLVNQGKQIGIALQMYWADNAALPSSNDTKSELLEYCKSRDIFFRPGTETDIFTYHPYSKLTDIKDPHDTIIGTLDSGYSWKINIYADGHVKSVPKE